MYVTDLWISIDWLKTLPMFYLLSCCDNSVATFSSNSINHLPRYKSDYTFLIFFGLTLPCICYAKTKFTYPSLQKNNKCSISAPVYLPGWYIYECLSFEILTTVNSKNNIRLLCILIITSKPRYNLNYYEIINTLFIIIYHTNILCWISIFVINLTLFGKVKRIED